MEKLPMRAGLTEILRNRTKTLRVASPLRESRSWRCALFVGFLFVCIFGSATSVGQGPQSQADEQAPVFSDPRFQDRVWEAGGPLFQNIQSGLVVSSIRIEGNQTVSENRVLAAMETRADRVFDAQQLTRDINALYSTELFSRIDTYFLNAPEGVHIRLVLHEKPVIQEIVFHGNKQLSDKQLLKHTGISVGDPTSPASVEHMRSRLEDLYRHKGFNDVSVGILSGNKPHDRAIAFQISEGELNRIRDISIIGSQDFSEAVLKTHLQSRDSRMGLTTYIWNVASEEKLEKDSLELIQFYRSLGYFDAKVDSIKKYDESGKWLDLTYVVSEGARYNVNEVSVTGNQYFESDILLSSLKLVGGNPYKELQMRLDAQLLRDIYGSRGFAFCDITPITVYLPDNKVNLVYEIEEGDVYVASDVRVHIAGDNSYTKHRVVLNQLGYLRPGRIVDSRELTNAERRLRFSQIFEVDPSMGEPPRIELMPYDEAKFSEFADY